MATQTTHFHLIKPTSAERVAVGDINDNSDIIDGIMFANKEKADQIADDYNASETYNIGDYCRRENYIYKCNSNSVTGTWDVTKWDRVKVMESVDELKEENDDVWSSMNVLGSKNLLVYPYYKSSHTDTGITWTVNDDGTVVANGTVSSTTATSIFLCRFREPHSLKAGRYILSGCPSGGTNTTYYMWMCFYNGSNVGSIYSYGGDTPFEVLSEYENYTLVVGCYCRYGYTANNLKFYPMIRPAEYQDSTYAPYAMTNKELTENKVDWASENVLGAKNLLAYPYYDTTKSIYGIDFTLNSDGSVTANGRATGNAYFRLHTRSQGEARDFVIANGKYIANGCPSGGSTSTYYIVYTATKNGVSYEYGNDIGEGLSLTLAGDDFSANEVNLQGVIYIMNGTNVNNLTFYPMIRPATISDSTYAPYAMTNKDITNIVECNNITAGTYTLQATVASNGAVTYEWVSTT